MKKDIYYQIDGIYFPNKGDELMYRAIVKRINEKRPKDATLVYGLGKGSPDPHLIRSTGVFQLAKLQRFRLNFEKLFPEKYLYRYGLVREEKIKAIFDAGGFQFGDQWRERYSDKMVKNLEKYYKEYVDRGTKIIILPQALGPFEEKLPREVIQVVHKYATHIFARDIQSYNFLKEAVNTEDKISLSPDFTCLVAGDAENPTDLPDNFVVLIPNVKMMTHTNDSISKNYISFMSKLGNRIIENGKKVVFLNHEAEGDKSLIEEINGNINNQGLVYNDLDAVQIKSVIKRADILISSRFHGVVSGLSQGVPTFCTSWSHKYLELLESYNLKEHVLDVNKFDESMLKINKFLDGNESHEVKQQVHIKEQKNKVNAMWNKVFQLIN